MSQTKKGRTMGGQNYIIIFNLKATINHGIQKTILSKIYLIFVCSILKMY